MEMAATHVGLRQFDSSELIFDEEETKTILKFLFKGAVGESQIDSLQVNDRVRNFAQGLLVEAIDASYAMGFVEALFRASANPTSGAAKVLKSFGKKALKHWFKHATAHDLRDIKIYETVRLRLAINFKSIMLMFISGVAMNNEKIFAVIDYDAPLNASVSV
jgi:hypothetical protein